MKLPDVIVNNVAKQDDFDLFVLCRHEGCKPGIKRQPPSVQDRILPDMALKGVSKTKNA